MHIRPNQHLCNRIMSAYEQTLIPYNLDVSKTCHKPLLTCNEIIHIRIHRNSVILHVLRDNSTDFMIKSREEYLAIILEASQS